MEPLRHELHVHCYRMLERKWLYTVATLVAERVPQRSRQQTLRELDDTRLRALVDGYAEALEPAPSGAGG